MTLTQENFAVSFPPVDPAALRTLLCRAGLAVAVVDESGRCR